MHKDKRDFFGWAKRLWRERRPMAVSLLVLVFGLPIVITLALTKAEKSPAVDSALKQAQADTEKGDYAGAYDRLKSTENQASTKTQKIALYNDLAAAAANAGQPQEAIEYLLKKHQLEPEAAARDAYMLAALYEEAGNEAKALEQYKIALNYYRSLPKDPAADARAESIEAVIADLEGDNENE